VSAVCPHLEDDIWKSSAVDLGAAVRRREVSAVDLVNASLDRIDEHDGDLKAFVTVDREQAIADAAAADSDLAQGRCRGPLHGIPVGIKDNTLTKGLRTTFGSKVHAHTVPDVDDLCVARLKAAGAIVIGKTNTPEFGCGALCTNELQGPTANPYNLAYTSGGSSGGSAAAVCAGLVPLAQGTDFGGSVRTPASFCGIVGLRPTPGRVPIASGALAWSTMNTHGILARNVRDAALMLEVMSGEDLRDPLSSGRDVWRQQTGSSANSGVRVACSADLNFAPIDARVRAVFDTAVKRMQQLPLEIRPDTPDCTDATKAFETLRAVSLYHSHSRLCRDHRDECSSSFVWNVERGQGISAQQYVDAEAMRTRIYRRFAEFFQRYDFLVTLSAAVPPFPNSQTDVASIDGNVMANIIDYLRITYIVSLVGFPALSIPCGWTKEGFPIGLQIIAAPFRENRLVEFGAMLEQKLGFAHRWPDIAATRRDAAAEPRVAAATPMS
jgi:amidase